MAYRSLRRRSVAEPAADPRAEELRRKLAESKPLLEEREEFEAGETPVDESELATLEEKRTALHERGREAAREMRGSNATE
jgi:hypothetical protein